MNLNDPARTIWARLNELAITPLAEFCGALDQDDRAVLLVLLAAAVALGFFIGSRRRGRRRRGIRIGGRRFPSFQNKGEAFVSDVLGSHFGPPDYHLMNHVTLRMDDGTTQVDHVLVSRFGVFVIETKHYTGWLFGKAADPKWTKVRFKARFNFQNPILQNARHVRAVRDVLDFLTPDATKSVVVFTGDAEFKTEIPEGVVMIDQLADYLGQYSEEVMSLKHLQYSVGRLETERLALSRQTDVEHRQSLARRHGSAL